MTDCNSLVMTLNRVDPNPQIARWVMELRAYDAEVVHRNGVNMGHVDALSRCHPVALIEADDLEAKLRITQNRDADIVDIRTKLETDECEPFELHGGAVYRRDASNRLLLYVPSELEENVIRQEHESTAHSGIVKCMDQLALRYWFPGMKRKVERFIRNCLKCIMYSGPTRANEQNLHSIPNHLTHCILTTMDHCHRLDRKESMC